MLSVISLFLFRNSLLVWMKAGEPTGPDVDSMVGEMAVLTEDVPPGEVGKVELRGASWSARNAGSTLLPKGHRARMERVDRFTRWISSEDRQKGIAVKQPQTTFRSKIGKIDLDRTFEERTNINIQVVNELDKASEPWGIKVLRYEIKNITPPRDVPAAMEKQRRAEREKRAVILTSEDERDAAINQAEGVKQQVIKASEAKKQQQINEAEDAASAILAIAYATPRNFARSRTRPRCKGAMKRFNSVWRNSTSEHSESSRSRATPWCFRPASRMWGP